MSGNTALYLWCGFVAVILILCLAAWQASGVELSIVGHSAGHGWQNMTFSGDFLNVTVNDTVWNISAVVK